jgi:hypothetical protein
MSEPKEIINREIAEAFYTLTKERNKRIIKEENGEIPVIGKYIRNLARCRNSYEGEITQVEIYVLLENTMVEIQNLLAELGIDWKDYSGRLE